MILVVFMLMAMSTLTLMKSMTILDLVACMLFFSQPLLVIIGFENAAWSNLCNLHCHNTKDALDYRCAGNIYIDLECNAIALDYSTTLFK